MTDANIREIWMPPLWEVGDGTIPTSAQCEDDDICYILATPEALAASPGVQALIDSERARIVDIIEKAEKPGNRWVSRKAILAAILEEPK